MITALMILAGIGVLAVLGRKALIRLVESDAADRKQRIAESRQRLVEAFNAKGLDGEAVAARLEQHIDSFIMKATDEWSNGQGRKGEKLDVYIMRRRDEEYQRVTL